jgi:hypothetical protein
MEAGKSTRKRHILHCRAEALVFTLEVGQSPPDLPDQFRGGRQAVAVVRHGADGLARITFAP